MDNIIRKIKDCRNVTDSSLKMYRQTLNRLFRDVFDGNTDIENLYEYDSIMQYLDDLPLHSKKNIIAAILVAAGAFDMNDKMIKLYRQEATKLAKTIEDNYNKQEKSEKEKKNWMTLDEILLIRDNLQKQLNDNPSTKSEIDDWQRYVILCLYTMIKPVRNNYAGAILARTREEIPETGNYLSIPDKKFVSRTFKTVKKYGEQHRELPKELMKVIKKWSIINPTKWLLYNIKLGNQMSAFRMVHILNDIFYPKKISSSMLRKIYLSTVDPVIRTMAEKKQNAANMQHDVKTQTIYRKK